MRPKPTIAGEHSQDHGNSHDCGGGDGASGARCVG